MKFWNFLATRFRFPATRMSPAETVVFAAIIAGFVLLVYWQDQRDLGARADVLRRFFALPAEVALADLRRISKSSVEAPRIEAVAHLTQSQFDAFAANLDHQPIWQGETPTYAGAPLAVAAPETLKWRELPLPPYVGNSHMRLRTLSEEDAAKMRRGRVLCIVLQPRPASTGGQPGGGEAKYSAGDCATLARGSDQSATIVVGVLDFDTKKLHMLMN